MAKKGINTITKEVKGMTLVSFTSPIYDLTVGILKAKLSFVFSVTSNVQPDSDAWHSYRLENRTLLHACFNKKIIMWFLYMWFNQYIYFIIFFKKKVESWSKHIKQCIMRMVCQTSHDSQWHYISGAGAHFCFAWLSLAMIRCFVCYLIFFKKKSLILISYTPLSFNSKYTKF